MPSTASRQVQVFTTAGHRGFSTHRGRFLRADADGADTTRAEFSHAGVHSKLSYRLDASRSRDGGFANKADDSDSSALNLQATYRPTLADSLTVRAGVRETDFDSETFRYPRERQFKSNYQQFVWDRTLSFDEDIRLQLYHNAFRSPDVVDVVVDLPPPVPGVVDYSLQTDRYDIELQHRWRPGELWRGGSRGEPGCAATRFRARCSIQQTSSGGTRSGPSAMPNGASIRTGF